MRASTTAFCLLFCISLLEGQSRPIRVAIYDFDQSNVAANIRTELGHDQNYGKVVADMLLSKLMSDRIQVINRDQIERLLKEQNYKYSDRFDVSQATQYGKLLGVDAIITGTIDSLYTENRQSGRNYVVMNKTKTSLAANVEVTAKLISAATGATFAAPNAKGTYEKELGNVTGGTSDVKTNNRNQPNQKQTVGAGSGSTTTTKQAADPYLREAIRQSVEKIGQELSAAIPRLPVADISRSARPTPRSQRGEEERASGTGSSTLTDYIPLDDEIGTVIKVSENTATFTLSRGIAIKPGEVFEVQRADFVADPRTGKRIAVGEKVGTVSVTEVRSAYSRGELTGKVAVNDRIVSTRHVVPVQKKVTVPTKAPTGAVKPSANGPAGGKPVPPPPH
jgi:curli biogenesis system outer membrane secretion channel CsgG